MEPFVRQRAGVALVKMAAWANGNSMSADQVNHSEYNPYRTKTDMVTEHIRGRILRREYAPGEWLRQDAIARELNVSQTPVREALRALQAERLVEYVRHRGIRVARFDQADAQEFYTLRALLECFAIKRLVARLNDDILQRLNGLEAEMVANLEAGNLKRLGDVNLEWHYAIVEAVGMPQLLKMWTSFPWSRLFAVPGRSMHTVAEHKEIMVAIRRRDEEGASRLMEEHLLRVSADVVQYLEGTGYGS